MFYFAIAFIVISVFLLVTNRKEVSNRYFICVMLSYTLALLFMMIYLAKDTYYNNTIIDYFSMPLAFWKFLMFLPVNKTLILCLWNLSCVSVPYFSLCFALSFIRYGHRRRHVIYRRAAAVALGAEYILYHPLAVKYSYLLLYPAVLSIGQLEDLKKGIHAVTCILNISLIVVSIILLVRSYYRVTPLKIIRHNMALIVCSYTLIVVSYLLFMGGYPMFLMRVSKISGEVFFSTAAMSGYGLHAVLPWYLIGTVLIVGICLYRFDRTMKKINRENATLSKQIAASDTTSKVFCHYMKNELLAVQSQLEELSEQQGENELLQNAISRCGHLYERLDSIHRSTKASELFLIKTNVCDFLENCLSNLSCELEEVCVELKTESRDLFVMADENYLEQAFHNVFINAVEAMKELPQEKRKLIVTVKTVNNWISIFIRDTGKGIEPEQMGHLFVPFYTSHPLTKHWGVGLALTHKMIMAHEGYIEIESVLGSGTCVKIMLPLLNS